MHTMNMHSEDSDFPTHSRTRSRSRTRSCRHLSTDNTCTKRPTKRQRTIFDDETWDRYYNALSRYAQMPMKRDQDKDGNWNGNIPQRYITDDEPALKLGQWVSLQRITYKKNKLKKDRKNKLEEVGFLWDARHKNGNGLLKHDGLISWQKNYDALCRYAQMKKDQDKNGNWNGCIPKNHVTDDEPGPSLKLGKWVDNQRSAYKNKKLGQEQVTKLEEIGLLWDAKDFWQRNYGILCRYVQMQKEQDENGKWDGNVPRNCVTNDEPAFNLGHWIHRQRSYHKTNKLSQERVAMLDELGLLWDATHRRGGRGCATTRV